MSFFILFFYLVIKNLFFFGNYSRFFYCDFMERQRIVILWSTRDLVFRQLTVCISVMFGLQGIFQFKFRSILIFERK
jgi:hypothetical protein